ncbi:neutral ceramidase B-like isoform X2 [Gigantopelta aegis]|uniref:neutral ceramidase B-like isoform X2 n=1 Tax=Gigantopelta aegis TaxID=1735272 RepID=UPI001B88D627|nr:neutral ceramidase B-like isoform X2 [Gigantopelta aegis]
MDLQKKLENPEIQAYLRKYDIIALQETHSSIHKIDLARAMTSFCWFAVHCTSMNNTNRLISGDNKGYASQLFEKLMNPDSLPGQGTFVAAFAQSNEGDVSPNTKGPHCTDSGLPCDILTSTCHGSTCMMLPQNRSQDQ